MRTFTVTALLVDNCFCRDDFAVSTAHNNIRHYNKLPATSCLCGQLGSVGVKDTPSKAKVKDMTIKAKDTTIKANDLTSRPNPRPGS